MRVSIALLIAGHVAATLAQAAGNAPPFAGEAVVVVGSVTANDGIGSHVLQSGGKVTEGTTVETAAGGYAYIVTVDKGFISVRPNSSLTIARYRYDAASPEKTEIKIVLNRGVVRAISGRGAQAARENYRMNTPVVALGIRGTDFSVFADATTTRAEVRRGGIVITPFGAGCSPSGNGPCEGPLATQLFKGDPNVLLQFRQGDIKPVALDERFSSLRPDRLEPPRKGEATQLPESGKAPVPITPGELAFAPPVPPIASPVPSSPAKPAVPEPLPQPQQLFWGRWGAVAALPTSTTVEQLQQRASELVAANQWFAMARIPSPDLALPIAGRFDFKLDAYEAYLINPVLGSASAAQILNPAFSVDFGQRQFNTQFDVAANGATYKVVSQGSVLPNGHLQSELISPTVNANVRGALAGAQGTQAGFIFSRPIDGTGLTATGATTWSR
ncbi:FecR family protein [Cupriavidus basilensis]|uniref:FecR family protein n=1 Tax=Cupriavidus basilensis TaxID=68895 RepID=UPI0023E894AA|nr:FecR domain-containing protein [Cupriavidus basilensis]MDF3886703.1 FecR domain-containing protein [Cupriavidus basilensis]